VWINYPMVPIPDPVPDPGCKPPPGWGKKGDIEIA